MLATRDNFPLLDELLAEQQRLDTPVARFSAAHENGSLPSALTRHASVIPLSAPGVGEQYAFEVDLDSCTGCKSCVAACHSLNGLEDTETWRDVGQLVSTEPKHPFTQTVTTACHHCADPACLNGCPVLAYEKDPATGIVRHLDDQCIGCSYCILKCPYDVPKFSSRLGIVRKCDMCHGRLAHGEAPACAQACPTHAIRIITVPADELASADCGLQNEVPNSRGSAKVSSSRTLASVTSLQTINAHAHDFAFRTPQSAIHTHNPAIRNPANPRFLRAAPDPSYTRPTTRYVSKRPLPPNLVAGDAATLRPQPPHWPLIALTTLMAMAVGCGIADKLLRLPRSLAVLSWSAGAAALALSVLHLGQPRRAWRIFLGLRQSWLSREAVIFGLWFPLATSYTALRLAHPRILPPTFLPPLASATALCGITGLFCSAMIYVDTRREFWRLTQTVPRFLGSAIVLGLGSAFALAPAGALALGLALAVITKLGVEARTLRPLATDDLDDPTPSARVKTARLLGGPFRPIFGARACAALVGGALLPFFICVHAAPAALAWVSLALVLSGEIAERYLFFRAVDAPKMPGLPTLASSRSLR